MRPTSQTVTMTSQDLGTSAATLCAWKRQLESKGAGVLKA